MSQTQLIQKILAGDVHAYGELVGPYEAPLLRYIVFLVHDNDLAEDILQDTLIKAYQNLAAFQTKRKFSSWLYRIAHNTAMDAVRKRQPQVIDESTLERATATESGIAEKIDHQILAKDVKQCLSKLHIKYQEPLLLYYFQHKSYADIGDILRLPPATVGVRIGRAKQQLRVLCNRKELRT